MFKKLRLKFIVITMAMVAVVMALSFVAVCVIEYQRSYSVVQTALTDAIEQAKQGPEDARPLRDGGVQAQQGATSSSSQGAAQSLDALSPLTKNIARLVRGERAYADELWSESGLQPEASGELDAQTGQAEIQAEGDDPKGGAGDAGGSGLSGQQEEPDGLKPAQEDEGGQSTDQPQDPGEGSGGEPGQRPDGQASPEGEPPLEPQALEAPDGSQIQPQAADPQTGASDSAARAAASQGAVGSGVYQGPFRPIGDESVTINDENTEEVAPPVIGNVRGERRTSSSLIPVAVYRVGSTGEMTLVPEVTTASISSDILSQAADAALLAAESAGTFGEWALHYLRITEGDTTYLAFADTSYTDGWKSLALMLAVVGACTLAAFLVVCLFYSRWALAPVKEAWESQKRFVADASHDLKTPLTVILANASILLAHPDHTIAAESQWVESTQREAEDMQGLVNEMLELAQIEDARPEVVVRDPIDFSDLVDGETLLFDSVALERGCEFACRVDGEITVLGNEKQIRKMVSTLVENAFKYVDEGGSINVVLTRVGKMATLDISNTGSVIDSVDLPHIFDRFYRTDKARTSGTGGFGLGLAIAREIATQHGGDIVCRSSQGEGTTFTITLPVA